MSDILEAEFGLETTAEETDEQRAVREEVERVAAAEAARIAAEEAEVARVAAEVARVAAEKEAERLALAVSQHAQAFRCVHHLATSTKPLGEVADVLATFEPEAVAWAKAEYQKEADAAEAERAAREAAGFSVSTRRTFMEGLSEPKRSRRSNR